MNSKRHLFRLLLISILACSVIMLAGCGEDKPAVDEQLTIHLFRASNPAIVTMIENHPDMKMNIVNDGNAWTPLLQVNLSESDAIISEDEIKQYYWQSETEPQGDSRQIIVLDDDIHKKLGYLAE